MRKSVCIIGTILVGAVLSFWIYMAFPHSLPDFPEKLSGISFAPFRPGNDPNQNRWPSREEIRKDMKLLSGKVLALRTYSVEGILGDIPEIAKEFDFSITLGAWISDDLKKNEREIERVIRIANSNRNVTRIIVGNEALLRKDVTVDQLIRYLGKVRQAVHLPVSTAEPWHMWVVEPKLAHHVDFLAVQLLPWWEGVPLNEATDFVVDRVNDVKRLFPGREVVISEVGWPSNGLARLNLPGPQDEEAERVESALGSSGVSRFRESIVRSFLKPSIPSPANQANFIRTFLGRAQKLGLDYYLLEAFDQPWKSHFEGAIGSYWGIYDAQRKPKFPFTGSVPGVLGWPLFAGFSVLVALLAYGFFMLDSRKLSSKGRVFLASVAFLMAMVSGLILRYYANHYFSPFSTLVAVVVTFGLSGVAILIMVEAHEMAEASWRWIRFPKPPDDAGAGRYPKVSIHVPAYNEPPAMMIQTLNALARLDYPDYEVLVIDNNTKDPAVWRPVEAECARLGPKFTFFHVDPLSGFKAGALNYVLERTAEDAEIVAVIDSDYIVSPDWLKDLTPHFLDPDVACVQAPQDYRPEEADSFKSMCLGEYMGFFHIGMITRNERNSIIQHGTMTMVRKDVLRNVGRWGEWCITEDAELGLRLLENGHKALYVPKSYGKGILPDRFIDYKKQRFRWAYGSIQIMKRHAMELFRLDKTRLTLAQRYHFLAGWIPWIADGANLIWTLIAVGWSMAMLVDPKHFGPPSVTILLPIFAVFLYKVFKGLYLYRVRIGASWRHTLGATIAGMSLSHTVARAVILGICTKDTPFFRTPKCEDKPQLIQAFAAASEEMMLMLGLWIAAIAVLVTLGIQFPAAALWSCLLFVQSLPYMAAGVVATYNVRSAALEAQRIPAYEASQAKQG